MRRSTLTAICALLACFVVQPADAATDVQMLPPTDPTLGTVCDMLTSHDQVLVFNGNPAAGQSALNCNTNFTATLDGSLSIGSRIFTRVDGNTGVGYFWIGPPNLDSGGHAAFGYHYNGSAVDFVQLAGSTVYVENKLGIGTSNANSSLDLSNKTDAISLPAGATLQRPSLPATGMTRYNSDPGKGNLEYFSGATNSWAALKDRYIQCSGTSGSISGSYVFDSCVNTRNGEFCIAYNGPGGMDSGGINYAGGYQWTCLRPSNWPVSSANNWPWSAADAQNISCSMSGNDINTYLFEHCDNVATGVTCQAKNGAGGVDSSGFFWSGNFNWDCRSSGALPW